MDELEALRQEYAKELPGRLAEIQRFWSEFLTAEATETLQKLQNQVHKLAGSGAVYGFVELSDVARELDTLLLHMVRNGALLNGELRQKGAQLLERMKQAVQS